MVIFENSVIHNWYQKNSHGGFWVEGFICIGLMTLPLLHSLPIAHLPQYERSVVDTRGIQVSIPENAKVVAFPRAYLPETHAPERLFKNTLTHQIDFMLSHLYPALFVNDTFKSDAGTLESILARDSDIVTLGNIWIANNVISAEELRGLGVVSLDISGGHGRDEQIAEQARVTNEVIGQPAFGMEAINRYRREFNIFRNDFQPLQTDVERPRFMRLGASNKNWSNIFIARYDQRETTLSDIGARDAVEGFHALGRQQDAERVLAIDADVILLMTSDAREFMRDPRWRGLKAVRTRHVYTNNPAFNGYIHDIDHLAFSTRWLAEILHPNRIEPKVRELLREHYMQSYGYMLRDDEIDEYLCIKQNSESAGYRRFLRRLQ